MDAILHGIRGLTGLSRGKLLRIGVALIVAMQLGAIFVLCKMQMRRAETRIVSVQVQRSAFEDCMRTVPRATLGKCSARVER